MGFGSYCPSIFPLLRVPLGISACLKITGQTMRRALCEDLVQAFMHFRISTGCSAHVNTRKLDSCDEVVGGESITNLVRTRRACKCRTQKGFVSVGYTILERLERAEGCSIVIKRDPG